MEQQTPLSPTTSQDDNLKEMLLRYLRYWPWFLLSAVIAIAVAFLYVRYSPKLYQTNTQIKILKENESGLDLTGLEGAGAVFDMNKVNLQNEIQILTSRRLLEDVVEETGMQTRYFIAGNVKTVERWKTEVPFSVRWKTADSILNTSGPVGFQLRFIDAETFRVRTLDTEPSLTAEGTINEAVALNGYAFQIVLKPGAQHSGKVLADTDYLIRFQPKNQVINSLVKNLQVNPIGDKSEVLTLGLQGENPVKNEAILNNLTYQFNQDGIKDKRLVSERTGEFIEERLRLLFRELDTVESGIVSYKEENKLVDIEANIAQLFTKEGAAEAKRFELETQKAVAQEFQSLLNEREDFSLLPANLGIESETINTLTASYNDLILQRNKLLVSSTKENPLVVNLDEKILETKSNILKSIQAYIRSLETSLATVQQRESTSTGKLIGLPKKEKEIRTIIRQRDIKEKLYLFLLQKREEAALQLATVTPIIKIVDFAYTKPNPVAPKTRIVFLGAFIVGLLIPFGILYLRFMLDTKINNKEHIKQLVQPIPVIGEIPEVEKKDAVLLRPDDRSITAEAFRILRTNLAYFKAAGKEQQKQAQVIYITSSTKGEGKTYTAINLASSLAAINKKVLLMGCDLRNPQLHNYIEKDKQAFGVSSYLYDTSITMDDLIIPQVLGISNLDVILSGAIPPNPAELLLNGRFETLIDQAKQHYDYILVDTAPTILVTDTLLISQLADVTLYLTRANYTEVKLTAHIKEMYEQQKLTNMALIVNSVDDKKGYGYNYGYGYGYSDAQPPAWWQFWKR
ncbi:GumC family protein [Marixanthomonas spongiae]|uniref:non-specific protein-tyrosine kinase n=1 Tax=Marixanthomonas spongiae TaxID=2174845 RepID=A0A2U0I3Q7_9FLAO|nr:polysaccharide biosynthesis tyrosine autokinase [Marixanthomonas spongiae]PVW15755.1 capsule biosynthesis protein [Marixanthomonas spongiae]